MGPGMGMLGTACPGRKVSSLSSLGTMSTCNTSHSHDVQLSSTKLAEAQQAVCRQKYITLGQSQCKEE